jgi:hypothetical protein
MHHKGWPTTVRKERRKKKNFTGSTSAALDTENRGGEEAEEQGKHKQTRW